jgi:hypothetical protein
MRFEAHPRLLELLVGSNLYPEPAVVVRELIQNAQDAIQWHKEIKGGELSPSIAVRFSEAGSWFEVSDNGIGMSRKDFEESFLKVGRNKLEALGLDKPPGEQIAFFGIGVLSVFLVADSFEVVTRKVGTESGLHFLISGLQDEVKVGEESRSEPGTTVRVRIEGNTHFPISEVPAATRRYVRHVEFVRLDDVDRNTSEKLNDTWATEELESIHTLSADEKVRDSRVGFSRGLSQAGVVSNAVVLTNAGFLVEERALDLLPLPPVGYGGEIDLHANALNIVMARERFQRDQEWSELGKRLKQAFEEHVIAELGEGSLSAAESGFEPGRRNQLLIWFGVLSGQDLTPELQDLLAKRVRGLVQFPMAERDASTLARIIGRLPDQRRIYVRRVGSATQRSRHIDDEGLPIQLVEEIRDSVRVGALVAKGFPVIEATALSYTQAVAGGASTVQLDEFSVIQAIAGLEEISVLDISQAAVEDMALESVDQLPVIRSVLDVGSDLRFARVPDSNRRVVTDPSGIKYLNTNSPTIRRLLKAIPEAVSNPLRRRLLQIYLGLEDFRLAETRDLIMELLEGSDLAALATTETAVLTKEAVKNSIDLLLKEYEQ